MQSKLSVQQPPRSGSDYPFITGGEQLAAVVLDLAVEHPADAKLPLRVTHAENLDAGNLSPSSMRLRIVDRDDNVVFDTASATYRSSHNWGVYYGTHTWTSNDDRILRFTVGQVYRDGFPSSLTSLNAVIDPRTYLPVLPGVKQLNVFDRQFHLAQINGNEATVRLKQGFNTAYTVSPPTRRSQSGSTLTQTVTLSAVPQQGLGQFPGCGDAEDPFVRSLNRQGPGPAGNFLFSGSNCFRVEPVVTFDENNVATVQHGEIRLFDDCEACCDCDDYLRPYYAVQRAKRRTDPLIELFGQLKLRYDTVFAGISDRLACSLERRLRLEAAVHRECEIAISAGLFNGSVQPAYNTPLTVNVLWLNEANAWVPADLHHVPAYALSHVSSGDGQLIPIQNRQNGQIDFEVACVGENETRQVSFRVGLFGNRRTKVCLGFSGSSEDKYICRDVVTKCGYLPPNNP